jgi:hypothetical protein
MDFSQPFLRQSPSPVAFVWSPHPPQPALDFHARQLVDRFYVEFLHRDGEPTGVAAWEGALDSGALSPDQVAQAFLASDDFLARTVTGLP